MEGMLSPAEAGRIWRAKKFEEFLQRAKDLHLEEDNWTNELLCSIARDSEALDQMIQEQEDFPSKAPWWADGEYDEWRADEANDLGIRSFSEGDYKAALSHFTEAVRMKPNSPRHHSNLSAAGLKCNQPGIAEESAEWALKFDPTDAKAGKRLQKARCMLSRNRTSAGVKNAERDELPREDLTQPCESASEQIRAADCALNVSKADHPAQCSRIEALIRCHRFRDAIHEAGKFDGVDACYLKAEAHLRSGQPGQAADEVKRQMGVSQKCARLFGDARAAADSLSKAKHLIASASHPDRVCEALACILDASNHCRLGAAGLRCEALTMKADSMLSTRVADEALEEAENALNEAISLDQGSVYALQQRARLFGCKGEHEEAVMDLRQALLHCNERHILRDLRRHARKAQAFHALGTDQTKNEDEQGLNVRANGLANLGESPDGVIRLSDIRWPQGFNLIEDMAGGPGASWEDKKHAARELRRCALQNANPQSISSFYSDLLFLLMAAWHPDRWQGKNLSVQQRERILQGVKEVFQRIELERDRLGLD